MLAELPIGASTGKERVARYQLRSGVCMGAARFCVSVLGALVFVFSLRPECLAQALVCSGPCFPYNGGGVLTNASVINLYATVAPPTPGNWDSAIPPGHGLKKASLDAWTAALIASAYFRAGSEYGIGTPTFLGSVFSLRSCLQIVGRVLSAAQAERFVSCNSGAGGPLAGLSPVNLLVNVLYPPSVSEVTLPDGSSCKVGGIALPAFDAYHASTIAVPPFANPTAYTVMATTPACIAGNFATMSSAISHELIEAMTDPYYATGFFSALLPGEVADACEGNAGEPAGVPALPYFAGGGTANAYWSNSGLACVPPQLPSPAPTIGATPTVNNENASTVQLNLLGIGFGTLPAPLSPPTMPTTTPYLDVLDTTASVSMGNSFDGDGAIAVGYDHWSDFSISVQLPTASLSTCDALSVTVANPISGFPTTVPVQVPGPTTLAFQVPASIPQGGTLSGNLVLLDSSGNAIFTATPVTVTINGTPRQLTANGPVGLAQFGVTMAPPVLAANIALSASLPSSVLCGGAQSVTTTVAELPIINDVNPDHGLAGAQTAVTLLGNGLSNASSVLFGTLAATQTSVAASGKMAATAPSQPAGNVTVNAQFQGASTSGTPPTFTYFTPDVPVLSQSGCKLDNVLVQGWGTNGQPLGNASLNVTTNNATILGAPPSMLDAAGTATISANPSAANGSLTVSFPQFSSATSITLNPISVLCFGPQFGAAITAIEQSPSFGQDCPACVLSDVSNTPDNSIIYEAVAAGLIDVSATQFQPDATVTQAQLMAYVRPLIGPRATIVAKHVFGINLSHGLTRAAASVYLNRVFQQKVSLPAHGAFTRRDLANVLVAYAKQLRPRAKSARGAM